MSQEAQNMQGGRGCPVYSSFTNTQNQKCVVGGMVSDIWYVSTLSTSGYGVDNRGQFVNSARMTGYTKFFGAMLDSSVWQLSKEARILWVTMLLKKDRDQLVQAAIPGLAHAARLSISETESALAELGKPDPYSQSDESEGRRVIKTDMGWLIANGAKYRDKMSFEERKTYKAAWQKEYRKRKKDVTNEAACDGAQQAMREGFQADAEINGRE